MRLKMQAAVVEEFGQPLAIREWDIPSPAAGQILVHCLAASETVCSEAQYGGYTKNGGFAEYILADLIYVARVPDGLSARDAAPIICAGVTTFKGIKETAARPGEWIAISGVGGLGHLAIQYAQAMGPHVCAVDIDDAKLTHATRLGADCVVNAKTADAAAAVISHKRRGFLEGLFPPGGTGRRVHQ